MPHKLIPGHSAYSVFCAIAPGIATDPHQALHSCEPDSPTPILTSKHLICKDHDSVRAFTEHSRTVRNSRNNGWDVRTASQNLLIKICNFLYPIYDLIINSVPYNSWPELNSKSVSHLAQTDVKGMRKNGFLLMVLSMLMKQQLLIKTHTYYSRQFPYPIWKQNGQNRYLFLAKTAKNHTRWGRTHLYIKGVHPPPPLGITSMKKATTCCNLLLTSRIDVLENNEFFLLQTCLNLFYRKQF